jgi:hypothetical protein
VDQQVEQDVAVVGDDWHLAGGGVCTQVGHDLGGGPPGAAAPPSVEPLEYRQIP